MPWSVGASSAWKGVTSAWVGVGGAWKKVISIKVGAGGAWKESFATVTVSGGTIDDSGTGGFFAAVYFNTDGTVDEETGAGRAQIAAATDWIIPNGAASSEYEIRATPVLGSPDTGSSAVNTWLNLGTTRLWNAQSGNVTIDIEIRLSGVVLDSGQYLLRLS